MTFWITSLAIVATAYLMGALPTAYLLGRGLKGVDIRAHGSGSSGATNALRVLGAGPALAVLLVDAAKGAIPVALALWVLPRSATVPSAAAWIASLAGLAAILSHSRSIFLGFSGGKSVATGFGVLLALFWPAAAAGLAAFALTVAATRIVSLGSMLAAVAAMVTVVALDAPWPYRLLVLAGGTYVVVRHRANLNRLWAGKEPRLGGTR